MNRTGILFHSMHDASHLIINSRAKEIKVCLMGPLSRSNYHNWAISIKFVSHNNTAYNSFCFSFFWDFGGSSSDSFNIKLVFCEHGHCSMQTSFENMIIMIKPA